MLASSYKGFRLSLGILMPPQAARLGVFVRRLQARLLDRLVLDALAIKPA